MTRALRLSGDWGSLGGNNEDFESGTWRLLVWYKYTNILEEDAASTLAYNNETRKETKNADIRRWRDKGKNVWKITV
jgi:hypothetical protein